MLLDDLIEKLPPETEEAVKRTRERLNQHIREALRQETGLRFRRMIEEDGLFGNTRTLETTNIQLRVEPGYPESIRQREPEPAQRLPALLAPWRGALAKLKEGSEQARLMFEALELEFEDLRRYENVHVALEPMSRFAGQMLAIAGRFDFVKWILDVNEDVLGLYTIVGHQHARVDLYWGVIGLVSGMLATTVEDLTVVVLAHELAHAFTHLGLDIDGHCWPTEGFAHSDRGVLEGLAQYYTHRVCERLTGVAPGARGAYAMLLPHQPWQYRVHETWIQQNPPEEVRLAMLQARRVGPVSIAQFHTLLDAAGEILHHTTAADTE